MDENPNPQNNWILISAEPTTLQMAPGSKKTIRIHIQNRQRGEDLFEISVKGIPIEWVALDQRMVRLASGETRAIDLVLFIQDAAELRAGRYPFVIQTASQAHPEVAGSVQGELTVAAYQSQGRIGVLLGHLTFAATPGAQTVIPILVQNRGLATDTFHLEVRGLPPAWITTTDTTTMLDPGEQKEIAFAVMPPRSAESTVGAVPFTIAIHSQLAPNQPEMIRCSLNLAPFYTFNAWMEPRQIGTGDSGFVHVRNEGNIADVFAIEFLSQDGALLFDRVIHETVPTVTGTPPQPRIGYTEINAPEVLRVQPGQTGTVEFRAKPSKTPIFGREFSVPFSTRVVSSNSKRSVAQMGEILARALIPLWVPIAMSIVVLALLCVVLVSALASQNLANRANQTAQAQTALALMLTGTQTGTVFAGSATPVLPVTGPTATPVTPSPTFTPITPTLTFTSAPPTPTPTPMPPTATPTTAPPTATFTSAPPSPTFTDTSLPATATVVPRPAISGTIVFQSNRDGNPEIYAMNAGTGAITRLTANQAVDSQPALAPDGVRVAYVSNQSGNNDIYLTGTDLRTPVNLTNNPADDQQPAWSPDGKFIAFTSNRDGNAEIYVMNADGSQAHNITNNPANDFGPSWFQTGGLLDKQDWILFTSNRDGNEEVYIIKPDGTGLKNLTNNPANDYSPSGSSNLIAFVSERDGNQEIYTMSVDGTGQTNITNNPGRDYDPVISPDGAWIAFTSERDGNPEIYVIRTDGSQIYNLTQNAAQDMHPSWR